jgi:hypothetical protein
MVLFQVISIYRTQLMDLAFDQEVSKPRTILMSRPPPPPSQEKEEEEEERR